MWWTVLTGRQLPDITPTYVVLPVGSHSLLTVSQANRLKTNCEPTKHFTQRKAEIIALSDFRRDFYRQNMAEISTHNWRHKQRGSTVGLRHNEGGNTVTVRSKKRQLRY